MMNDRHLKYRIILPQTFVPVILVIALVGFVTAQHATASDKRADEYVSVEDIEKSLELADDEPITIAMSAVRDGVSRWKETAFYMLLKRVSTLGKLKREDFDKLDPVSYYNLLHKPQRYRCKPMLMKVRLWRVLKMTGRTQLGRSRSWPKNKPVWRLYCTIAESENHWQEPITIYSTVEPIVPGEPTKVSVGGEKHYGRDPAVILEVACVFYKMYTAKEKDGGAERKYPLLLAWQVESSWSAGKGIGFGIDPYILIVLIFIVVAGLLYYFIRRHVKRLRKGAKGAEYTPRRDAPERVDASQGYTEPDSDDQVDPLLKEAAEEYSKERQQEDGTDRQG